MMMKTSFRERTESTFGKFVYMLIYIVVEWTVILLLFVDGIISFLANGLARFFELKVPCMLCTRIDHHLIGQDPDCYYNDSICESHRKDMSPLAYCHAHRRLSDIRQMCEGCLLSFNAANKPNREMGKAFVGCLGADLECSLEDDHKVHLRLHAEGKNDETQIDMSSIHRCSCCGEPLRVKSSFQQPLVQNNAAFPQAPTPSPRVSTLKSEEARNAQIAPLPHIRYNELKFMSDTESEVPDDEDGAGKEDVKAVSVRLLAECDDASEGCKTPSYVRANRLLNLVTESASGTPRGPERIRKLFAEKSDSNSEFMETNSTNESDGEIILSHLKKQVRLDRKSLIALYMELDEERSASAVAAHQAMAMITRLQAEKAAMQMEALQYQRMMEEQAEYDHEALQLLKEMLFKRDEEIKVLEAELRACKQRLGEELFDIEVAKARDYEDYQRLKFLLSSCHISDCGSPRPNFYEEEDFKASSNYAKPLPEDGFGRAEGTFDAFIEQESQIL